MKEVSRHKDVVADQIQYMKEGVGVACWPKPSLHPKMPKEVEGLFELEACSFCNRWYSSFDVVMASCKHFYHPFCIAKLIILKNCALLVIRPSTLLGGGLLDFDLFKKRILGMQAWQKA